MITENQLFKLGYEVKTGLIDGSIDFRISDSESSPYLVNLQDGSVRIDFGNNVNTKSIEFDDFENFKKWHQHYNQINTK